MNNRIPVFYRPEIVAHHASRTSPSAAKPAEVVADWQQAGLPINVRSFEPADRVTLALAHDRDYVDRVLNLELANGFGNRLPQVAASLPYTTGAMLAAGHEALRNRRVACAPVSGFHHAGHAQGGGFCTFNGLMVTALALRRAGLVERVGILDLDFHWGDGTDDICRRLQLDWVQHHSPGLDAHPLRAARYLKRLPSIINGFRHCDVLLYQAGADAHVDDPLGGWMTDEQLALRDRIVFEGAVALGVPVAWNLAGGYRRDAAGSIAPVLAVHRRTFDACAAVHLESASLMF